MNATDEDEDIKRDLQRIDPHNACGYISLASTLFNLAYSIFNDYYTWDVLISVSLILGIVSVRNGGGMTPRVSLGILAIHLSVIFLLRMM